MKLAAVYRHGTNTNDIPHRLRHRLALGRVFRNRLDDKPVGRSGAKVTCEARGAASSTSDAKYEICLAETKHCNAGDYSSLIPSTRLIRNGYCSNAYSNQCSLQLIHEERGYEVHSIVSKSNELFNRRAVYVPNAEDSHGEHR